ncbi:unnamed protein product [Caretta caretta]
MEAAAPLPGGARRSRSSGLLLPGPGRKRSDAQLLEDALGRLSGTTAAITANVRRINVALERILEDKATVEELNQMLMCQGRGPGLIVSVQHQKTFESK